MIFANMIDNRNTKDPSIALRCSDVGSGYESSESHCWKCSEKIKTLSEDLAGCNVRISDLLLTIKELNEQVAIEKHAAYHWWLAHDKLRAQLDSTRHDRAWKSAWLLHAVRCLLGKSLKLLKRFLRPIVLGVTKKILANPRLYRIIKPISRKFPFVYRRLRELIVREQAVHTQEALFGDDVQEHTAVYLDKNAVRVLAALKQAKGRK